MFRPFYSHSKKDWMIDEVCVCGKLQSEHESLVRNIEGTILRLDHEGGTNLCNKYRFDHYANAQECLEIKRAC